MVNYFLMTKPIIAFDMDGTLLDVNGRIRPQDKEILLNCRDAVFIVASGRQRFSIRQTFVENGLFVDEPLPFPLAMANGGVIYRGGEELIEAISFDLAMQEKLLQIANGLEGIPYAVHGVDYMLTPKRTKLNEAMEVYYKIKMAKKTFTDEDRKSPLIKFLFFSEQLADLQTAERAFSGLPVATCYSSPVLFEINPLGVNKGEALRRLQKHLGMEDAPLFTAGDGGNDVPMLKEARVSFAPATASQAARDAANVIIDTEKDGLLTPMLEEALKS
jgi:Cof subfamily protein (haloacid dehalogenase superfamily)